MSSKMVLGVTFAAACLMAMPAAFASPVNQLVTNGPQSNGIGNSSQWSPSQNVRESHEYDHLLETNLAFRRAREQKECGSINDPQLHANCVASFSRDEPVESGSSTSPMHNSLGSGQ